MIKYLGISQFGIHFNYYGDEIIFLWPWKWHIEEDIRKFKNNLLTFVKKLLYYKQ